MCIGSFHADSDCFGNRKCCQEGSPYKGGVYLEEMGGLKAIAFDKTGTLTKGVPVVTDYRLIDNAIDEMLAVITALEDRSQHPLASAIIKADGYNLPYSDIFVEDFSSNTEGKGIRGKINNEMYYVGSPFFEEMEAANFNDSIKSDVKTLQEQGKTVMVAGTKNTVQAIIAVADEVRESSKAVIRSCIRQASKKQSCLQRG